MSNEHTDDMRRNSMWFPRGGQEQDALSECIASLDNWRSMGVKLYKLCLRYSVRYTQDQGIIGFLWLKFSANTHRKWRQPIAHKTDPG
jgi:hypothetical protein